MESSLNPSQRAVVEHDSGPLLVLAGAGSGKTRVVTHRIARLIEKGTPAWSIVAMTFTNKAAEEMRERISRLIGNKHAKELRVATFHSFGLDMLSSEAAALGFRNGSFTIFDQADSLSAIREVLRTIDAGKRFDVAAIQARISLAKNRFETPESWVVHEGDEYDEIAKLVYPRYRAALQGFQALDFDDLVTEAVRILRDREDVRRRWQAKIRYLMVDEYQDTNASQLMFVRLLVGEHRNVMVVGDDDQAIYAWRGADVRNILDFEEHFRGAKVVKLEENYRSVGSVLQVANAVLAKSTARRHGKVLRATREDGPIVELIVCPDSDTESAIIADEIHKALERDSTLRTRDVAVLYRSNGQSENIELALKERNIAYRMVGGQRFYERKEVKDLLAYLRVVVQPKDEISLRRVINYPARGIGEVAMGRLSLFATARDLSLWQAVERADAIEELPAAAREGCNTLTTCIAEARQSFETGTPSHQVATDLAERIGLKEDLMAASSGEVFARRWRNVESILRVLQRRDERSPHDLKSLGEYLRLLMLQNDTEEQSQTAEGVTLSTMHGAKGLEFRLVLIAGLEDGILPHSRTIDGRITDAQSQDIEEERRLFYVSITRAKDRLLLFRTKFRTLRGKAAPRTPSRFLLDIPSDLIAEREVAQSSSVTAAQIAQGASSLLAALGAGAAPTSMQRPVWRR